MPSREHLARALWTLFEPIHAVTYFSPQARAAFADVGLTRYWDGYFAGRAAPLGAVGAAPVAAMFSGFSPMLVGRALPAVWSTVTPQQALDARSAGAAQTLRDLVPDEALVARASDVLRTVAERVDTVGRPLAAANAALPDEADPYRRLWQSAATLREHRGDGHVIALVAGDVAGLDTIVLRSGLDIEPQRMKGARGWSDEQWMLRSDALESRGLLAAGGRITPAGVTLLNAAEQLTNRLALGPWGALDDAAVFEVARALHPVAAACGSLFPYPNPIGMPQPWHPDADPGADLVPEGLAPPAAG